MNANKDHHGCRYSEVHSSNSVNHAQDGGSELTHHRLQTPRQ